MTLDELAAMLELPAGHFILALGELPDGHVPGLSVTIAHGDDVQPTLPKYRATDPLLTMDLAQYRRWGHGANTVRTALRSVEIGCADDCTHPSHQHGYTPARAPMTGSDAAAWPKFPGQDLPITGSPVHADPGDEDMHMGGPRL